MIDEAKARELGLRAMACKGWTWTMPWCSLPDKHGRVWRRNWCPQDSGFGWTQLRGRRLREPRDSENCCPDFRDPASLGCLLALVLEAHPGCRITLGHEVESMRGQGSVCYEGVDGRWHRTKPGLSLVEALVAALEQAP